MISDEIIEEVKRRNDIVDVIGSYVHIQKKGSNYQGLCPFHNEKTPSFMVSQSKQIYKCFGCGKGGNVFMFIMEYEGLSFIESIRFLAEKCGVTIPDSEYNVKEAEKRKRKRDRLLEINKEAATYFYYQLRSPRGETGLNYFKKRELTDKTMKNFGLGYSLVNNNDLTLYLRSKGFEDDEIVEAGLATFNEKYGMNDKFWNRVMFPIQDMGGRVIAFGGRVIGEGEPKYLNSPETPIFDKSRNLYGFNHARSSRKNRMILCEGYMDVIAMHQAGFTEAVASLGTAFTSGQASLLKRYCEKVILAYDSDEAGTKAAMRAIEILRSVGLVGRVLHLEPHKDPDEFIKAEGKEAFEKRLEEAEDSFVFELRIMAKRFDLDSPESKSLFRNELVKKLFSLHENFDDVKPFIEKAASLYGFDLNELTKSVAVYGDKAISSPTYARRAEREERNDAKKEDTRVLPYKLFLTLVCDDPSVLKSADKYITRDDFPEGVCKKAYDLISDSIGKGEEISVSQMMSSLLADDDVSEEDNELISGLFTTRSSDGLLKMSGAIAGENGQYEGGDDAKDRAKDLKNLLVAIKTQRIDMINESLNEHPEDFGKIVEEKQLLQKLKSAAF